MAWHTLRRQASSKTSAFFEHGKETFLFWGYVQRQVPFLPNGTKSQVIIKPALQGALKPAMPGGCST
jgi:hypothetical protein